MSSETNFIQGKDYTIIRPIRLRGHIVHGFKRGSTQLGFPTANLNRDAFQHIMEGANEGVYIGWAQVLPTPEEALTLRLLDENSEILRLHRNDLGIKKTMLSLGKNVQFDAEEPTLEAYIHHEFVNDFYDHDIEVIICAYIREQKSFDSLESLIAAIQRDVDIGNFVLENDASLSQVKYDPFFTDPNDYNTRKEENLLVPPSPSQRGTAIKEGLHFNFS